jgi:signal transduction histidine kinase
LKKNKSPSRVPGSRPLKSLFFHNYMVISGLLFVTLILSLFGSDFIMDRYIDTLDFKKINSTDMYRYPFDNINGGLLEEYGGWFEVVNGDGDIIYVKGNKKDKIKHYQPGQIFAKMDLERNDDSISYHAYPGEGPHGEPYILLWKIPAPIGKITAALGIFFALFAAFLFVAVYFYSRYSVRQVKKPLRQIMEGIKEMEQLNYNKRIEYSAEKEFVEIQNAFNGMAERLQRTSVEKEAAENNKRNLLLHLSHDLKTPITSIYGYSQLLLDNQIPDEAQKRKYLQYIYDKSAYMAHLIKDLFELAKLDDRKLSLSIEKVNITKWFQQMIVEYYPEIEEKGFRLEAQVSEEPVFVSMDKVYMNRVITNLISNSLKYNPAGTLLFVSCEKKGGNAVFCVGDNGIGVEESIREHIFDEFVRSGGPGKDSSGLGLAICRKIIGLHQGTIILGHDDSCTTLFQISLPCEQLRIN